MKSSKLRAIGNDLETTNSAAAWPDRAIVQQLAAQIPWFHNCILIDRVANSEERAWLCKSRLHKSRGIKTSSDRHNLLMNEDAAWRKST